jgi:hypothetical protein
MSAFERQYYPEFPILPVRTVEAARLLQRLKNDTVGEESKPGPCYTEVFSDTEEKYLCDRLKDLLRRGLGCTVYHVRRAAFIYVESRTVKHPRGNKKMPIKTCSLLLNGECVFFCQNSRFDKVRAEGMNRNVGFKVLTAVVMESTIFWDITLCSQLNVNRLFGRTSSPSSGPKNTLVSCSAYSSALKMGAMCSSETPVEFQLTTLRYIPEDSTFHE